MSDNGPGREQPSSSKMCSMEVGVRECTIHSVVVYSDRAEVKRTVPVHLSAGENEVVVNGLSQCVDKNSIRVEGEGVSKAVITEVIYSSETTSSEEQPSGSKEEYERLKGKIREGEKELQQLMFRKEVLGRERQLLTQFADHICKIHSVKGDDESLGQLVEPGMVAGVMEFLGRYQDKIAGLDERTLQVQRDIGQLEERLTVLRTNAEKVNPEAKVTSSQTIRSLHVGLEASEETDVTLLVSYVVSSASWTSAYDVRVFTKNKAMKVQYYGQIKQSTGEDWENANISLSTAQPSIGGSAPSLPTRLIRFKRPPPPRIMRRSWDDDYDRLGPLGGYEEDGKKRRGKPQMEFTCLMADVEEDEPASGSSDGEGAEYFRNGLGGGPPGAAAAGLLPPPAPRMPPALGVDVAKVSSGLFNTTYAIPRATTIPADSTEHKVTVALVDLDPEFHYISVPRLSPYSFLQAKAKNTSPYTMLAGPANVFLDNNFIAKSRLKDVSPNEEFTTSLGADQSIRITCHPVGVVHGSRSGMVKKSTLVTYTHSFTVKNTRADSVSIQLSEQVPLSTDERIKVNVLEPDLKKSNVKFPLPWGYALLNGSHNVEWHTSLSPDKEVEPRLVYTVEYPLQDDVQGLPKH